MLPILLSRLVPDVSGWLAALLIAFAAIPLRIQGFSAGSYSCGAGRPSTATVGTR